MYFVGLPLFEFLYTFMSVNFRSGVPVTATRFFETLPCRVRWLCVRIAREQTYS